jgi:hypothetical protein
MVMWYSQDFQFFETVSLYSPHWPQIWDLPASARGQARIRESLGLLEHIWLNVVFQIEHSSLSLSLLFSCKCVVIHTLVQVQLKPPSPGTGTNRAPPHSSINGGITGFFPSHRLA